MQYVLPIWETLSQAWEKTNGSKKIIWQATFLLFVICAGLSILNAMITYDVQPVYMLINSIIQAIANLLLIGLINIGIKQALSQPISYRQVFDPFKPDLFMKIVVLYLLQTIIYIAIGIIGIVGYFISTINIEGAELLALPFYLVAGLLAIVAGIRMALGLAFVIDKKFDGAQAIKASFMISKNNFFNLLIIFILQFAIFAISAVPFFIGLIWTVPFLFVSYGVIYRKLLVNLRS